MHLAPIAATRPDDVAYIMAPTGESLTFAELDGTANQLAHYLRGAGVAEGDSLLIVLENCIQWPIVVAAGMRIGLLVTPVNWHLQPAELADIIQQADPRVVVASGALAATVDQALGNAPRVLRLCTTNVDGWHRLDDVLAGSPRVPVEDERLGARVLYSGGSTGRPRAHAQALPRISPADAPARHAGLGAALQIDASTRFLSPAPSYHAAPFTFQLMVLAAGGTVVCLQHWGASAALGAIVEHQVTHSQWVPTMLVRLLAVPHRSSYPLAASHRVAITSGAPCPPELKDHISQWWGPILHEYYGASEGYGHTYISPEEAMTRRGSVGRSLTGEVAVLGAADEALPAGEVGRVQFRLNDASPWRGMGDLGYLDQDAYLYLVGRESFMIISGGVNIHPEEIESTLLSHPDVSDAAVIGVPDDDFGEQVLAVVEPRSGAETSTLDASIDTFLRDRIAAYKVPRQYRFVERLPRLPTGKLNKRALREQFVITDTPGPGGSHDRL